MVLLERSAWFGHRQYGMESDDLGQGSLQNALACHEAGGWLGLAPSQRKSVRVRRRCHRPVHRRLTGARCEISTCSTCGPSMHRLITRKHGRLWSRVPT